MPPKLILFDVDGTLLDAAGAGRRALEAAFRALHGTDGIERLSARVRFEGKTDPVIIEEIAREAGIPAERVRDHGGEFRRVYLEALARELERPDPRPRALPGVRRLLDELRSRSDVHLGLITGNIEDGARAKLRSVGLEPYFAAGGFASDHRERPRIARIARDNVARHVGTSFSPEHVTVVGDTDLDVACARANGFRVLAVYSGFVSRERLEASAPDALLDDLTDLDTVLSALGVT